MERSYKTKSDVPAWVDPMKVLEWTFDTTEKEGVISIHQVFEEASKVKYNWLLFFAWIYARTSGFTTKGMRDWDYGNFGGKFKTSRDGIKDALSEFVKYDDTEQMNEGSLTVKIYDRAEAFCRGVVYDNPTPLPIPVPTPEPVPIPEPKPEPKPEPAPDEPIPAKPEKEPQKPSKPLSWGKVVLGLLVVGLTVGSYFVPGWAKVILDMAVKVLSGL
jgi:hypothetical protein